MQVQLYQVDHGECPYLANRTWVTHGFQIEHMSPRLYENLTADGWRRSGMTFYQNHCPGCQCCTPVRVPVADYCASRSQRRAAKRNSDVDVTVEENFVDEGAFALYDRYIRHRHNPEESTTVEQFRRFLVDSPVETITMRYASAGRLIGVGWVDVLPNGLSSVYYAFEPDEGSRSLGVFSIIKEIEYARQLGKEWLYLGFYVPGSTKMEYKGAFLPHEFGINGQWTGNMEEIECLPQ